MTKSTKHGTLVVCIIINILKIGDILDMPSVGLGSHHGKWSPFRYIPYKHKKGMQVYD